MAEMQARHVKYQPIHEIILAAFPQTRLDNLSLRAGCERWQDGVEVVKGSGMYSEIKYTGFDVIRERALARAIAYRISDAHT